MKNKFFSVVTVCFNAQETIEETVVSVTNQKFRNLEYIVVDGQSNDNTLEILSKHKKNIGTLISERDSGIYDAMNKAAEIASGKYIIYMNANDVFVDEYVLSRVAESISDCDYAVVFGDYFLNIGSDQYLINAKNDCKSEIATSHQAIFCKTQLVKEVKFDVHFKLAADFDLLNKVWKMGPRLNLGFPVCIMEGVGFSANKKNQIINEYFHIISRHEGVPLAVCVSLKMFVSMLLATALTKCGLGRLRAYLRRIKGWALIR